MTLLLRIDNADDVLASEDRQREWTGSGGTIGRADSNDWVLADTQSEISRIHAKIYFEGGDYYLEDMSTNGVYLGSGHERIEQRPYKLQSGDILHIGHYQINVMMNNSETASVSIPSDISFDDSPQLIIDEPPNSTSRPADVNVLLDFDEQSSFSPTAVVNPPTTVPFIPEDWDANSSVNVDIPAPAPEPTGADNNKAIYQAQKEAVFESMGELLSCFDARYINSCLSLKGGREQIFEHIFHEHFMPVYQRKLDQSS